MVIGKREITLKKGVVKIRLNRAKSSRRTIMRFLRRLALTLQPREGRRAASQKPCCTKPRSASQAMEIWPSCGRGALGTCRVGTGREAQYAGEVLSAGADRAVGAA